MTGKNLKKFFSIILAAVILVANVVPADVAAASKPARPTFKVAKRTKKSVTLKIDKTKNATGYQIFISNSKGGKYQQVAASRIRTVKLTKLKKDKSYYVKVRAFKTVGFRITLGKFSKVQKIDKYQKKVKPSSTVNPDETTEPETSATPMPTDIPGYTYEPGVTATPEVTGIPAEFAD